jgi:hypothetical protein
MEGGVAWFGMRWVELKGRTPILWASCGGSMWNFPMVYGCIWYLPCMYVDEAESVGLGSSCRGWDHIDIFFLSMTDDKIDEHDQIDQMIQMIAGEKRN